MKSTFEPVPYNDNEEMKFLLDAFQKFVLHGDPNRDDGLYSLPHRAYKAQSKQVSTDRSSDDVSSSQGAKQNENSQNNETGGGQILDSTNHHTGESQDVLNQNQDSEEPDNETVNQNEEVKNTSKI